MAGEINGSERFCKKNPGNDDSFDVSQHISDSMYSIRNSNFKISEFYFCQSKISKIYDIGQDDFVSVRPSMVGGGW